MKLFLKNILLKLSKFASWHRNKLIGTACALLVVADIYFVAYLCHIASNMNPIPWQMAPTALTAIFGGVVLMVTSVVYFGDDQW